MMRCKLLNLLIIVVGVATSCTNVTDIEIALDEPKYVLNCLLAPDSSWHVTLTKSLNIQQAQYYFDPVTDATVEIYDHNDLLIESLAPSKTDWHLGQYDGNLKPVQGERYMVKAQVAGGLTLLARTYVPQNVPISSYRIDSTLFKSNGEPVQMTISIQDPPEQTNYYLIKVLRDYYYVHNADTIRQREDVYYELVDPSFQENFNLPVNDNLFNGKMHDFEIKISGFGYSAVTENVQLLLLTISEEYYLYLTTKDLQERIEGDPFAQPAPIFSNVENGIGIFAAYSTSSIRLK